MVVTDSRVTLPNLLSAFRLAASPLLIASGVSGATGVFAVVLGAALFTDAIDGVLARWRRQVTAFGARLDSAADLALYFSTPVAMLLLYPALRTDERVTTAAVALAYAVPITAGFIRFRRLTSYHTRLAKIAAVLLSVGCLAWIVAETAWLLRIAASALVVAAIDEIAITALLPEWRTDVTSAAVAWRLRQDEQ